MLRSWVPLRTGVPSTAITRSPLLQPAAVGRRTRLDAGDHRARGVLGVHRLREIGGQVLNRDADAAALDLAVVDQLVHDLARHVDRHGKADADIAAARRQDRGVDADQLAVAN